MFYKGTDIKLDIALYTLNNSFTIFGGIRGEGVLKSEDYGTTWQKKNIGLKSRLFAVAGIWVKHYAVSLRVQH